MYFHFVTLLPTAVDAEVAVFQFALCGFSVHGYCIFQTLAVAVGVKVARNYLAPYPSRDAYFHSELPGIVLLNTDGDVSVPGILRCLFDRNSLTAYFQVRSVGHEEVNVDIFILHRIDISRQ